MEFSKEPVLMWTELLKQHRKNQDLTRSIAMRWMY